MARDIHLIEQSHASSQEKAILMCLQIRCLFGLRLRQTQGFINSVLNASGLKITCPDYTTLSKCGKLLDLEFLLDSKDKGFNYVCMDSRGIQTYTGNESGYRINRVSNTCGELGRSSI